MRLSGRTVSFDIVTAAALQHIDIRHRYARWATVLLVVSMTVTLGVAHHRITLAHQQVDARRTIARNSIVAVTNLRRDGRKTQVAILERWLLPRDHWSDRDEAVSSKVADVVQSARAFTQSPVPAGVPRELTARLMEAVTAWSETTMTIIARSKDPNFVQSLNRRFDAIDRQCNEILELAAGSATVDDRASAQLDKAERLNEYAIAILALALVAGTVIVRARTEAATRVRQAERARLEQQILNQELENRVSSRTHALATANAQLRENMERLGRAQEELKSGETRYRDLFESMHDGVVVYVPCEHADDFVIKEANAACLMIESIDRADMVGRHLTDVFPGVREFGLLDCLKRVSVSGEPEHLPLRLYQDQRISGWRENFIYGLPTREVVAVYRDVTEQKLAGMALQSALQTTQKIVDSVPFAVVLVGNDSQIRRANDTAGVLLRLAPDALVGRRWTDFLEFAAIDTAHRDVGEVALVDAEGKTLFVLLSEIPVVIDDEEVVIEAFADLSERMRLETQLRHAQKLESVGQLAAGIAHEINTPAQYVRDSIQFLAESFEDSRKVIAEYRRALRHLSSNPEHEQMIRELEAVEETVGLAYIEQHAPAAFDAAADGIARIAGIVNAMKEFAHPDAGEKSPTDLNHAIQTALTIARNEYKYVADVRTAFGDLPSVPCHAGAINQVILNLLVNAAHAISDVVGVSGDKGLISVRTTHDGNRVRVDIADTGSGIPVAIRERIFDPFFTTKEVGKGSGQGLAIARSIIVDKHGGDLSFVSELGKGTTFTILLPLPEESTTVTATD